MYHWTKSKESAITNCVFTEGRQREAIVTKGYKLILAPSNEANERQNETDVQIPLFLALHNKLSTLRI